MVVSGEAAWSATVECTETSVISEIATGQGREMAARLREHGVVRKATGTCAGSSALSLCQSQPDDPAAPAAGSGGGAALWAAQESYQRLWSRWWLCQSLPQPMSLVCRILIGGKVQNNKNSVIQAT